MEDVLDLYVEPRDPERPVVCFDETSTRSFWLMSENPLPAKPGRPRREDYDYQRAGPGLSKRAQPRRGCTTEEHQRL